MSTVADIFNRVRHTINPAVYDLYGPLNEAVHVVQKRLYQLNSRIIQDALSISIAYETEDEYGDLPSDFWGLVSYPYLSGKTWHLKPLPSLAVKLSYNSSQGIPQYYEIKGTKMYLTPAAGADYTIVGDYWVKATTLTATTDTLPFNELFDDVLADYVKLYMKDPPGGVTNVPQNMIDKIDLVASKREKKAPFHTNTPGTGMGVYWDGY